MAGQEGRFGLSKYQLMELMSQRRLDAVARVREYGGVDGITKHLETNMKTGIRPTAGEIEDRVSAYGKNVIPPQAPKSFLSLCLDALQDKTLIILIVAAIISIVLGVTVDERKVRPDGTVAHAHTRTHTRTHIYTKHIHTHTHTRPHQILHSHIASSSTNNAHNKLQIAWIGRRKCSKLIVDWCICVCFTCHITCHVTCHITCNEG